MALYRILTPIAVIVVLSASGYALAAGSEPPLDPKPLVNKDDQRGRQPTVGDSGVQQPAVSEKPKKRKKDPEEKRSEWRDGYRVAVSFIQGGRYDDAISQLVSLEKSDSPDVLNYIGYANRKMGRMEEARVSYEAALALDPNHRGALEYYGEWHVEMGKLEAARGYLMRLASVCGTSCREYHDLAEAIALKTVH